MTNLSDELKNMKSLFKIELNKVGLERYSFQYANMAEVSGFGKHDERNPLGKKWITNPWGGGPGNKRPDDFEPDFHNIADFSMLTAPMPDLACDGAASVGAARAAGHNAARIVVGVPLRLSPPVARSAET